MPERFGSQSAPSAAAVPVTPGAGSSGFSSRSIVFGDSAGALTNNSSGPTWVTTAGFLGVGTTDPQQQIHISGADQPGVRVDSTSSTSRVLMNLNGNVEGRALQFGMCGTGFVGSILGQSTGNFGYLRVTTAGPENPDLVIGSQGTTSRIGLVQGTFAKLWINSSGHVGINTTVPDAPLSVGGTISSGAQAMTFLNGATPFGVIRRGKDAGLAIHGESTVSALNLNDSSGAKLAFGGQRILLNGSQVIIGTTGVDQFFMNSTQQTGIGTVNPAARLDVRTTVNGNAFTVMATTGGANPALNVQSTGATSKIGFWTTVGATRGAAYTTSGSTATRTVPTTVTTGTQTTVQVKEVQNAVNGLIAVVNNLVADFQGFGLVG